MGNQSPAYFYLARLSAMVFGSSELSLRFTSLFAGMGLIIVAGITTYRWSGLREAGWLAASLVAFDHNMIFFSQEARPYALVQFVALCQLVAFWRLQIKPGTGLRVAVTGGWVVMFYLHYTSILLMAGQLLWWAVMQYWQRGRGNYRPAQVAFDVSVAVCLCLVSWSHLADIATRRAMWELFISQRPPWVALGWFQWDLYVLSGLALSLGPAIVHRYLSRERRASYETVDPPAWLAVVPLLICWWAMPALIAWSLTAGDVARIFFPRYLIGVAVAPMVCGGLCLTACPGRRTRIAVFLLMIGLAIWGNGLLAQYRHDGRLITDRRQDWRGAVAYVNANRNPQTPVFVRSGLIEADLLRDDPSEQLREYCLLPVTSLYTIKPARGVEPLPTSNTGRLTARVKTLINEYQGGWFVINVHPNAYESLRREVLNAFPNGALNIVRETSFGNVAVWQVRRGD